MRYRSILLVVMVALAATIAACSTDKSDGEQQKELVQNYVSAVQAGDRAKLKKLVSPKVDATADIDAKVRSIGGRKWSSVATTWEQVDTPTVAARALVTAVTDGGGPIKDTVDLEKDGKDWHIVLGEAAPDTNRPTASTSHP